MQNTEWSIKRKTIDTGTKKEEKKNIDLYSCRTETTPRKVMYINDIGQIYKDNFTFREENPSRKWKEDIQKKRQIEVKLCRFCIGHIR